MPEKPFGIYFDESKISDTGMMYCIDPTFFFGGKQAHRIEVFEKLGFLWMNCTFFVPKVTSFFLDATKGLKTFTFMTHD